MKTCVFAGTFDPPTTGHEETVRAAAKIFDGVTVAVMTNTAKRPVISAGDRKALLEKMFASLPSVKVIVYGGTISDLLAEEGTPFYVRGVRDAMDLAYETRDFRATRDAMPEAVEILIPSDAEHAYISSSLVKNCVRFGKDCEKYLPACIAADVRRLLEGRHV